MEGEDEEEAVLSSSTMAILNQFLTEQKQAQDNSVDDPFAENWGMSQFWYTDATAEKVAAEVVEVAKGGRIACLACPSLFRKLRQSFPDADAWLFEYDSRFEVLGRFHLWDYNSPEDLPPETQHSFQVVIIDPPYLSAECLTKSMRSMALLGKSKSSSSPAFFALTGASVRETARVKLGLRPVRWRPEHKNKLGNEFCFYTREQATAERFGGWDVEL